MNDKMSVRLDPAVTLRVRQLADLTDTDPAVLAGDIVGHYVDLYAYHIGAVQEGIRDADAGRVMDHDQVMAWIDSWNTPEERKRPECG